MAEPTLTLTENELFFLPQGTPATANAVRLRLRVADYFTALVRPVKIGMRADGRLIYRLFFREERRPETEIFVSRICYFEKEPESLPPIRFDKEAKHYCNHKFQRCWLWRRGDEKNGLLLNPYGFATLANESNCDSVEDIHFACENYSVASQLWKMSTPEFEAICHELTENKNSPLHFYLLWRLLSEDEKLKLATHVEHGTYAQLIQQMTHVLFLVVFHFGPYPDASCQESYWEMDVEIPARYDRPAVFFARRWQSAIFQIIRPQFWPTEHLCVANLRRENMNNSFVSCATPTHHEFLEATAKLREFLAPHLPPDEIEALFRTDNL